MPLYRQETLFLFPCRNIPLAVIVSLVVVTVCYILMNVSYYAVLSPQEILNSDAVAVVSNTVLLKESYISDQNIQGEGKAGGRRKGRERERLPKSPVEKKIQLN